MTLTQLREILCDQHWAVEATVTPAGHPQAAVIGAAITDCYGRTNKLKNQLFDPREQIWSG